MKLSPLLSQFLLSNKQLRLSGIGRFTLDESGSINFQQDPSVKEDADLVIFIAEQSGKMKSLVSADLDSSLELARQFLNIGKPYLFEGIGTLSKTKTGYDFVQSNPSIEKNKESTGEGRDMTSTTENSFTDYEEMFSPKKSKAPAARKVVTWLVAIAGLSLAVFGGYMVYTRTKGKKMVIVKKDDPKVEPQSKDSLPKTTDPIQQTVAVTQQTVAVTNPLDGSGMYRFVIEQAAKQRALYRYNFLKSNFIDVKMDTKDSVLFKLYFLLPASPADTARKRDSLQRLYGTRSKTRIELN